MSNFITDNGTIRVTIKPLTDEDLRTSSIVSICNSTDGKKFAQFIFEVAPGKIEAVISENSTLVVLGSSSEGRVTAIEPTCENGIWSSIATTLELTKGSYKNLTAAPDGNSFTFAGGQFGRVEGYERWF
jgi:hypothetical protein